MPRVLVIDDEPAIRGVLRASLEASGSRSCSPDGCWYDRRDTGAPRGHDPALGVMMHRMAQASGNGNGAVRRVMVGTDRSHTASRAVGWAASFAERYGAELHLVQVVIPTSPSDTEFGSAER